MCRWQRTTRDEGAGEMAQTPPLMVITGQPDDGSGTPDRAGTRLADHCAAGQTLVSVARACRWRPSDGPVQPPDEPDAMDDVALSGTLQGVRPLLGRTVTNRYGDYLGDLDDVLIDAQSGRALYAVLAMRDLCEPASRWVAFPWYALNLRPDEKRCILHLERSRPELSPLLLTN